jgi:hypothetical protein
MRAPKRPKGFAAPKPVMSPIKTWVADIEERQVSIAAPGQLIDSEHMA